MFSNILNNISIKVKLYSISILPIIGILYLASNEIYTKYIAKIDAQNTEKVNILNNKIALYINSLQIDRGIGGSYLTSSGEVLILEPKLITLKTTNSFNALLAYSRNLQDEQFVSFTEYLEIFNKELSIVRKDMIDLNISADDYIAFYSTNINLLLDFISKSKKNTSNTDISEALIAYSNFLYAKEKTAIERVMVTNIFIKQKMNMEKKLKFNNLLLLRRININYFFKYVNDNKIINLYNMMMKKNNNLKIKLIEKKLLEENFTFKMSPSKWFNMISQQIEEQHKISKLISQKLLEKSSSFKNKMISEALERIYYTLFLLILFLCFIFYIFRNINKGLNSILSGVAFISENDISKYQSIEIELNDELGQIAKKFNEMALELQQRDNKNKLITIDLVKSKKEIEKSNQIKTQFLANMSHEIRTPLNAILGFINILKKDEQNVKKLRYFDIINSSSNNLLEIINDILDFSKIENQDVLLENREILILDELYAIINLFKIKVEEKKLKFTVDIDKNLPPVIITDGLKLKQVLTNLLSNAIKFTKTGKAILFTVKCKDNKINFCVKDEGIGVEEDKQNMIFQPFLQADNSTTRKYGGTGLGLAISKKLVDALGGNLKIKSTLNEGSEFYFSISIVESKKSLIVASNKINKVKEKGLLSGNILVVEDNKANQMFIKVLLKMMNLDLKIANDGKEAVDMFQKDRYDLILMDENMPNMTGIEATHEILKIEKKNNLKHTPIIALTANALVGDREKFLNEGMDEYLTKPLRKKELYTVLSTFLPKKKKDK